MKGCHYAEKKTKEEAIARAFEELVATGGRMNLLDLAGRIRFHEDYDYEP